MNIATVPAGALDAIAQKDREIGLTVLQGTISRLSSYSFGAKGWAITVTSGFIAAAVSQSKPHLLAAAAAPCLLFWWLDAYYLMLERRFRERFAKLIDNPEQRVDSAAFSPAGSILESGIFSALRAPSLAFFYLTQIASALAFSFV